MDPQSSRHYYKQIIWVKMQISINSEDTGEDFSWFFHIPGDLWIVALGEIAATKDMFSIKLTHTWIIKVFFSSLIPYTV